MPTTKQRVDAYLATATAVEAILAPGGESYLSGFARGVAQVLSRKAGRSITSEQVTVAREVARSQRRRDALLCVSQMSVEELRAVVAETLASEKPALPPPAGRRGCSPPPHVVERVIARALEARGELGRGFNYKQFRDVVRCDNRSVGPAIAAMVARGILDSHLGPKPEKGTARKLYSFRTMVPA